MVVVVVEKAGVATAQVIKNAIAQFTSLRIVVLHLSAQGSSTLVQLFCAPFFTKSRKRYATHSFPNTTARCEPDSIPQ